MEIVGFETALGEFFIEKGLKHIYINDANMLCCMDEEYVDVDRIEHVNFEGEFVQIIVDDVHYIVDLVKENIHITC